MKYENTVERKKIISCALKARTLPEIEAAVQAVQDWVRAHPEDVSIENVLEPLAMVWEGLQTETQERVPATAAFPL